MGNLIRIFFLLFMLHTQSAFAWQDDPVKQINQSLHDQAKYFPREKIYLQFNGDMYAPGDLVQFSGILYCQSAPSELSRIVYVELSDSTGKILKRLKLPVDSTGFKGSFRIPSGGMPASWFLRAYTAWMLNFEPAGFYYHTIVNSSPVAEKNGSVPDSGFQVRFFPEGGQLVERLTTRIAFRATDENGIPIDLSGKIIDSSGQVLANIQTGQFGMGSFNLHVSPRKKYYAIVSAHGIQKRIPLPLAKKGGITLFVRNKFDGLRDSVFFHLSRSIFEKEKYRELLICATLDDHRFFQRIQFDEITAGDPVDTLLEAETWLPLDSFPEGLVHLAVFNAHTEVLAERVFFHHRNADQDIHLNTSVNRFDIQADESWKGTLTMHSAKDFPAGYEKENIYSALLLTPEIKESLYRPGWYFLQKKERAAQLDLQLILIQDYFFSWNSILHPQMNAIRYQPEQDIFLKGTAFRESVNSTAVLKNGLLFLLFKTSSDSSVLPLSANTDTSGNFLLATPKFNDTATVYIQTGKTTGNKQKEKISIRFDNANTDSIQAPLFKPWKQWLRKSTFSETALSEHEVNPVVVNPTVDSLHVKLLNPAEVKAKLPTHLDSVMAEYTTGIFSNPNSWAQTIDFTQNKDAEIMDYQSVFEYLRNKVKGIEYIYDRDEDIYIAVWRMGSASFNPQLSVIEKYKSNAPAYFIDENLINSTYYEYNNAYAVLTSIPVSRVALIRVFQPGSIPNVPGNGPHGAFSIYLRHGNDLRNAAKPSASFNRVNLFGFSRVEADSLSRNLSKKMRGDRWKMEFNFDRTHKEFSFDVEGESGKEFAVEGIDNRGRIVGIYRGK